MADLSSIQPGRMSRDEGLAALADLWPPLDTPDQDKAEAWARRACGEASEPGDEHLLQQVDAMIDAAYGRSVGRSVRKAS
jgi:hypothetical protein